MDQNEMSNSCRGPSIDASYQVTVYLAKWFQRRRFDFIDASYQVSLHLAKWVQRGDLKKSTNQKQELPVVAMFVFRSGQNEQPL